MKLIGVIAGGVVVVAILLLALAWGIGDFLSPQSKLAHADAIVAISGGETAARAEAAIRLYKDGYAPLIVYSGAALDINGPSNARVMKQQAEAEGVASDKILIDETSANTAQNAAAVAEIARTHELGSLILVTSPYHQRRANISFSRALGSTVKIINHSAFDQNWSRSRWWIHGYNYGITLAELQKTLFLLILGGH